MKRYLSLFLVCAMAAATAPAFAQATDADKSEKADKASKEKADKDKSDKDKSDKADKDKSEKDKSDKSEAAAATPATPDATAAVATQDEKDDAVLDPAQPDFTLVTLPTTLRLPRNKSAFRVTHRFTRPLGDGDFGSLAEDFFGLDGGSQIGLEFRFGVWKGLQAGIHRTNDRTIQFFSVYDVKSQSATFPVGISAYASIDGTNNFRDSYSPAIGAVISRTISKYAAVYVTPIWVNNTNDLPKELVDDNNTFIVGAGARVRVHGSTYFVLELVPRAAGFDPGVNQVSFGVEKRVGGHSFQLNFSNAIGTTMGQIARGGIKDVNGDQDWYLGFNITRKFF